MNRCSRTSTSSPGCKRERDHFAGGVAREGDVARAVRLHHDERKSGKHALPSGGERHGGHVHLRIFPQQNVMREVDAVGAREVDVGDRHVEAFDLAERIAELELGHVLAAGQFAPAGFAADLGRADASRHSADSSLHRH